MATRTIPGGQVGRFAEPPQWNAMSPVMEFHQRDRGLNGRIVETMTRYFRGPTSFDLPHLRATRDLSLGDVLVAPAGRLAEPSQPSSELPSDNA